MLFAYIQSSNQLSGLLAFVQLVYGFICSAHSCQISKMTDRLVQIQYSDLPALKKLYTPDGSKSYIGYMTIDIYTQLLEKDPDEKKYVKFYCLNGDFSDGTFIVTVCILFCLTIEIPCKIFCVLFKINLFKGTKTCICGYIEWIVRQFKSLGAIARLFKWLLFCEHSWCFGSGDPGCSAESENWTSHAFDHTALSHFQRRCAQIYHRVSAIAARGGCNENDFHCVFDVS